MRPLAKVLFIGLSLIAFVLPATWFLILGHELGHYVAAQAMGVGIVRFEVGEGPELFGFQTAETDFSFHLFPLGGANELADGGYLELLSEAELRELEQDRPHVVAMLKDPNRWWSQAHPLVVLAGSAAGVAFNISFGLLLLLAYARLKRRRAAAFIEYRCDSDKSAAENDEGEECGERGKIVDVRLAFNVPLMLLMLLAILSLFLGLSNLAPVPGMDGYWMAGSIADLIDPSMSQELRNGLVFGLNVVQKIIVIVFYVTCFYSWHGFNRRIVDLIVVVRELRRRC